MEKSTKIILFILALIILVFIVKPKSYISEEPITNLEKGDEIEINDKSYFFQDKTILEDDLVELTFLDSKNKQYKLTIPKNSLLPFKRPIPLWQLKLPSKSLSSQGLIVAPPIPLPS